MERHFFKRMDAENLQSSVQIARQTELFVKDRYHQVNAHSDPDLGFHGVGAGPKIVFDSQVVFDPAEKEFDVPTRLVELGDNQSGNVEMVGQEDQIPACLGIEVANLAQTRWERLSCFGQCKLADLVAAQPQTLVDLQGAMAGEAKVLLGSRDEKCPRLIDASQANEVHVTAIQDVECSRFEEQLVEPKHVVHPGLADVDASRNRASQVDLGMQFDTCFGFAEARPREKVEREVDSRGVQSIDRVVDIQSEFLVGIESSCFADESLGQVLPQTPIPSLVGVGQSGLGNRLAESKMIECFGSSVEACLDIAQTFAPGQLREGHTDELLTAAEMPDACLGIVADDQSGKRLPMDKIENLRKNSAARVHSRRTCQDETASSNPSHPFQVATPSL